MTFVEFTKAFDPVSRGKLRKIMAKFGCLQEIIAMVRAICDDMLARVKNDGKFSRPAPVMNGVKQCCVVATTLFSNAYRCFSVSC